MSDDIDLSTLANPPVPIMRQLPEPRPSGGMTLRQYMASPVVQGLGAAGLALAVQGVKAILARRENRRQARQAPAISIQAVQITIWTGGNDGPV